MSNPIDMSPFEDDEPHHSRPLFDDDNDNDYLQLSRSPFDGNNDNGHLQHSRSPFDGNNDERLHSRSPFDGNNDNDHLQHSRSHNESRHLRSLFDGNNDEPFNSRLPFEGNNEPRHSRSPFEGNNESRHSRSPFDGNNEPLHSRSPFNGNNESRHLRSPFDGNNESRHSRSPFEGNNESRHSRSPFEGNNESRHSRSPFEGNTDERLHSRSPFEGNNDNDHLQHSRSPFNGNNDNDHLQHSRSPFDGNNESRHLRCLFDGNNDEPLHSRSPFEGNNESRRSRSPFDGNNESRHLRSLFDGNNDEPLHSRSPFEGNNESRRSSSPFDGNNESRHSRSPFDSNNEPHHSKSLFDDDNESRHSRSLFDVNSESLHSRSPFDGNNNLNHPMFNLQRSSSPNRNRSHVSSSPRRMHPFGMNHGSRYESPSGNFFLPQMNPQNLHFHQSQTSQPPSNSSWNPNANTRYPYGQSHPQNPVQTSARGERQDFSLQIPIPVMCSENSLFPLGTICQNKAELDRRIQNYPELPKEAHMKIMEMGNEILDSFECQVSWFEDNGNMRETSKSHVLFVRKERTGQSWLVAFSPFKGKYILSYNRLITQRIHCTALSSTSVELEPSWAKKTSPREQCVFNFSIAMTASKFMKYIDDLKQNTWDSDLVETERRRHDRLRASSDAQLARLAQSPPLMEENFELPMPLPIPRLPSLPILPIPPQPSSSTQSQPPRREERRSIFPDDHRQTISNRESQLFPREFSSPVQNSGMGLRNVFSGNIYNTGNNGPSYAEVCGGGNSARRSFCQSSVEIKYMEGFRECQVMRNVRDSRGGRGRFEIQCKKLFTAPVKLFVKKIVRSFDNDDGDDYREIATGTIVVQEKENELFREVCFYDVDGKLMMCHCIYAWNYIDLFSNSPLGSQKTYITCIFNGQSFLSIVPSPYPVIREFKAVFTRSIDASEFVLAFLDGVSKGKDIVDGQMQAATQFNNMDSDSNSNNDSGSVSNWFN